MRNRRGTGLGPMIASILVFIACALLAYQVYQDVEEPKTGSITAVTKIQDELADKKKEIKIKQEEISRMRLALSGDLHDKVFFDPQARAEGNYIPDAMLLRAIATETDLPIVRQYNSTNNRELPQTWGWEQTFPAFVAQGALDEPALSDLELTVQTDPDNGEPYYAHIRDLHKDMVQIIDACTKLLNDKRTERGNVYQQVNDRTANNRTLIDADRETIEDARTRLVDVEEEYKNEIRDRSEQVSRLTDDLAVQVAELGDMQAKTIKEEAALRTEIAVLESRVADLLSKKAKTLSETAADGEVIHVDEALGYAWVDLGHQHGVRAGMKFEVFSVLKGGRKQVKGMIEIRQVQDDRSQASIIEGYTVYDPVEQAKIELPRHLNPIVRGDRIRSPFFDPDEQQIFVFIGNNLTNEHYSLRELTLKIEEVGGRVDEEVSVETDFVIAIEHAEEMPEFKTALQFGISIMRERDLLKYLRR